MKWLFLPGLHCFSDIFSQARYRHPGLDVVVLDWPWPEQLASMDEVAQWLIEQIEKHQFVGMTGHSLGGVMALYLAYYGYKVQIPAVIVDTFLTYPHVFFRNHVWDTDSDAAYTVQEMLAAGRVKFPKLREASTGFETPEDWGARALEMPTQFIYGGRSNKHDLDTLARMAGLPEGSPDRVQVVPSTSHFLMLEDPDTFYHMHKIALDRLIANM